MDFDLYYDEDGEFRAIEVILPPPFHNYSVTPAGEFFSYQSGSRKPLAVLEDNEGYPVVQLMYRPRQGAKTARKTLSASHLVAEAFDIPREFGQDCVRYRDDDKTNLAVDNLYWDRTGSYNGPSVGHSTPEVGKCGRVLTDDEVVSIRRLYASGEYTQKELGEQFSQDQGNISRIVRGIYFPDLPGPITTKLSK